MSFNSVTRFAGNVDFRVAIRLFAAIAGILIYTVKTADANADSRITHAPIARSSNLAAPAQAYLPQPDLRRAKLESFFRKYNCPAPLYIDDYLRVADEHDLDYRLLPAISVRETQCGVHERDNNRLGFMSVPGGFATVLTGIEFIAHRLAEHAYYKGKTLDAKLLRYNPRPAYAKEIRAIMREIDDDPRTIDIPKTVTLISRAAH